MNVLTITVASAVTLSVNLLTITIAFATFSINVLNILICDFFCLKYYCEPLRIYNVMGKTNARKHFFSISDLKIAILCIR